MFSLIEIRRLFCWWLALFVGKQATKASETKPRIRGSGLRNRKSQAVDGNKRKAKDGRQAEERLSGLRKKRGEPPDLFKSNTKGKQREREEENTEGKQREREEPCKTRTVT
jgi:hypothetical protein